MLITSRHRGSSAHGLQQLARDYGFPADHPFLAEAEEGPQSTGSGVLIDASGIVLTNEHVVGSARTVTVTLSDKRQFEASVIGADARTDVAVLQLHVRPQDVPLPAARVGNSDQLRVGEWVVAVGHPFDFHFSVSVGILSAKGRRDLSRDEIQDYLQTDAAVNPGSSGGPLFNVDGELVGINTAIFNPAEMAQNAGIAFAIPSNMALRVARSLQENGRVPRASLGLDATDRPPTADNPRPGARVLRVKPGGPADLAGIRPNDVIVAVDSEPVATEVELRALVLARGVDTVLTVQMERNGAALTTHARTRAARDSTLHTHPMPDDAIDWAGLVLAPPTPARVIEYRSIIPEELHGQGFLVLAVAPASPAAAAGVLPGDLLTAVAGTPIDSPTQFQTLVDGHRSRVVTLWRGGSTAFAVLGGLERRNP